MSLRITELDFEQIKTNLKDFLRSQDEFNSYDFEASGLSVLIELMAYNTHYNAYLANQQHNEAFLDSAVKRESVVSKAKALSYTPRSDTAASAIVDIDVINPAGSPSYLTLDRYTPFTTNINGTAFTFVNTEPATIYQQNNVYRFSNVTLKEGSPYSYSYTSVSPGPSEKFVIPNDSVDTTSLTVTVRKSATDSTSTTYTKVDDITKITGDSTVYYLEENLQGKYEIFFGDGILGKKLDAGNVVTIRYIITSGSFANVSPNFNQSFTLTGSIQGNTNATVSVVQNSTGGSPKESINDIKFNAPRSYVAQNRIVTKDDYSTIIRQNMGSIESVNVWGGEDNIPPIYGKVFISLKPYDGYEVTPTQKEWIRKEILSSRSIVSVIPEFVDPEYLYVNMQMVVKYNPSDTTLSSSQIQDLVRATTVAHFSDELQKFNQGFVGSRLTAKINAADPSIFGSSVTVKVQKRIEPSLNVVQSYSLNFNTKIHPGDLQSTRFYYANVNTLIQARILDMPDQMPPDYNGTGSLYLYDADTGSMIKKIGSVNYATGEVTIYDLVVAGYLENQNDIRITIEQQETYGDVDVSNNQILVIDDSTANQAINRLAGITINTVAI